MPESHGPVVVKGDDGALTLSCNCPNSTSRAGISHSNLGVRYVLYCQRAAWQRWMESRLQRRQGQPSPTIFPLQPIPLLAPRKSAPPSILRPVVDLLVQAGSERPYERICIYITMYFLFVIACGRMKAYL